MVLWRFYILDTNTGWVEDVEHLPNYLKENPEANHSIYELLLPDSLDEETATLALMGLAWSDFWCNDDVQWLVIRTGTS